MFESTASEWNWVIAAYALTWTTLGLYTAHVLRRLSVAEREHKAPPAEDGGVR